jgi:hypothetical protein
VAAGKAVFDVDGVLSDGEDVAVRLGKLNVGRN